MGTESSIHAKVNNCQLLTILTPSELFNLNSNKQKNRLEICNPFFYYYEDFINTIFDLMQSLDLKGQKKIQS